MNNTFTDLIPIMYKGLDTVAREMVGFARAVQLDASAENLAKDQVLNVPIVPVNTTADITPAAVSSEAGGQPITAIPVTIGKSKKSAIGWNGEQMKMYKSNGTYEKTLSDQFAQALRALVNEVEADIAAEALLASRYYGTANVDPFATAADMSDFAAVRKILEDNGCPMSDLHLVLGSGAMANLRGKMSNLFKANEAGSDSILRTGALFDINGMAIHQSGGIAAPAVGGGSAYTSSAVAHVKGDTSIALITGTGTVLAGDVVMFAGDTNKYVVKTGVAAPGTIVLEEPGLRMDWTTATHALSIVAKSARNVAFHRSAIILLARQPSMPDGGDAADDVMPLTDPVSGITFQIAKYRQYRQVSYEVGLSWGVKNIKSQFVAGLLGAY